MNWYFQSRNGLCCLGGNPAFPGGSDGIIFVPLIKFDILDGLESMRGKLILVDLLGKSRPGFRISSDEGLGNLRSRLMPRFGFAWAAFKTKWEPPGGGLGNMRPVPVRRSDTGVLRLGSGRGGLKPWASLAAAAVVRTAGGGLYVSLS